MPAVSHLITGKYSFNAAIWCFRILFCLPAFIGGGVLLLKTVYYLCNKSKLMIVFSGLLYVFEAKSLIFSTNGMETAFMLLFIAWAVYLFMKKISDNWLAFGFCWGGLMWTRPDSFIYIAAMMVALLMFNSDSRRVVLFSLLKASIITTLLYLPWFVFAWIYYGSPIPHTVIAKGGAVPSSSFFELLCYVVGKLPLVFSWAFSPVYVGMGGWPAIVIYISIASSLFAYLYWLVLPIKDRAGKRVSFMFFCIAFYFAAMAYMFPWYFPPFTFLGMVVMLSGSYVLGCRWHRSIPVIILSLLCLYMINTFVLQARQMKYQQSIIEDNNRKQVGLWLNKNTKVGDRIYLEALGYIGYFSQGDMRDYPGLSSPSVVKLKKENKCNFITAVAYLKPEWIVARDFECKLLVKELFIRKYYR